MKSTVIIWSFAVCVVYVSTCDAASEMLRIVKAGDAIAQEHAEAQGWPANALKLINDPLRTDGWQGWHSGQSHLPAAFEFSPRTHEQVQHLVDLLATIMAPHVRIRFARGKEPKAIGGWPVKRNVLELVKQRDAVGPVSEIYGGKGTVAVLSIGTQKANDIIRNSDLPEAEKQRLYQFPTLTFYVGNDFIDPKRLKIPDHVDVTDEKSLTPSLVLRKLAGSADQEIVDRYADGLRSHVSGYPERQA